MIWVLAALLMLLSGGCGRAQDDRVTIRFWNGFTGPDGRTMLQMVRRFNEQNPDVQVLMQRMDWGTYYNKLFVAGLGGRAPEVFVLHTHALPRFAGAGFARPIDDLAEDIDLTDLDSNVWQATNVAGQHYGLPLDVHPLGMFINRGLFREAGVTEIPQDAASFVAAMRRVKNSGPNRWGFVIANQESNCYTFMRQFGGEFFTPDGSRCVMNNPQNVQALEYLVQLIREEQLAPPPENFDAWIGFRQGRVGVAFEGIYMLADLQRSDIDFEAAPVPLLGNQQAVWGGSHNLCLKEGLDERRQEASWRFMKYLSDNSLEWAEGGQVPVRKSQRDTDRFQAMGPQYQFSRQIPYLSYLPQVTFVFEFQSEFNRAVESVLRGRRSAQDALDEATANINRVIEREKGVWQQ
jgi:multiple sugar transport system substrate-binding protein